MLATKASSIHPRTAIAGWLYGVAHRTALRARTMNDRRRKYERSSVRDEATIATDPTGAEDLIAALDAEVARLPEHLRAAVVLCELQGRGRTDAAGDLGIPEGTLSSRLAAARKALAARLRSRGIVLSAAGLLAGFAQLGSASVPSSLASRAEAALDHALVPAPVADLFNGVLRIMFAQKLKAVPIAVGLSSMAVLAWAFFAPAAVPTHDTPRRSVETVALPQLQPAAAPKALPKGPNKLLFYRAGHLTLIDPDGKNEKAVSQDRGKFHPGDAKLSPDGKQLAILIQEVSKPGEPPVRRLHVRALEEKEPGTDLGVSCQLFAWSRRTEPRSCAATSWTGRRKRGRRRSRASL